MRLLTKNEAEVKKKQDEFAEAKKKQGITDGIAELLREFNAKKRELADEYEKLEQDSLLKIGELDNTKSQLSLEVRELETRKQRALEPLEEREKEVVQRFSRLLVGEQNLEKVWQELKQTNSKLNEETNLLIKREQEVKTDEVKIREGFTRLARQIRNFERKLKDQEIEDNKQRLYFVLRDRELKEREEEINQVTESNQREKTALEDYRIKLSKENDHIISQQRTLKAGFQLLKKKQDDSK